MRVMVILIIKLPVGHALSSLE